MTHFLLLRSPLQPCGIYTEASIPTSAHRSSELGPPWQLPDLETTLASTFQLRLPRIDADVCASVCTDQSRSDCALPATKPSTHRSVYFDFLCPLWYQSANASYAAAWRAVPRGNGWYWFKHATTGLCLTVDRSWTLVALYTSRKKRNCRVIVAPSGEAFGMRVLRSTPPPG